MGFLHELIRMQLRASRFVTKSDSWFRTAVRCEFGAAGFFLDLVNRAINILRVCARFLCQDRFD